jgi:hypothetical protein
MPTTTRRMGGLYVETVPYLGAARDEVPALQRCNAALFLYRQILRPLVQQAPLITSWTFRGHKDVAEKDVVEKEKPGQRG